MAGSQRWTGQPRRGISDYTACTCLERWELIDTLPHTSICPSQALPCVSAVSIAGQLSIYNAKFSNWGIWMCSSDMYLFIHFTMLSHGDGFPLRHDPCWHLCVSQLEWIRYRNPIAYSIYFLSSMQKSTGHEAYFINSCPTPSLKISPCTSFIIRWCNCIQCHCSDSDRWIMSWSAWSTISQGVLNLEGNHFASAMLPYK